MNIDKILRRELKYKYLNNVENGLNEYNLTFKELNNYVRCGRKQSESKPNKVFVDRFGDVKPPEHRYVCLCGHKIMEQCYLCPENSKDVKDIIVVGNQCIHTWGFKRAKWGKCEKVECKLCGNEVSKSGLARHQKRPKCKNNAIPTKCDNSTASTCSGDISVSSSNSDC
jgi:hypothetical protein